MPHTLVIVESPAKAKTIEGYLGKGYKVLASYGHVRDFIPKTWAVEPEAGFKMHYSLVEKNKNHEKDRRKKAIYIYFIQFILA